MRFFPLVRRFLLPCLLPAVLVAGCQAEPARPAASAAPQAAVAQDGGGDTLARLHALAADRPCVNDGQCHSLALGASPCGGPETYLAWSSARISPGEIDALGKAYAVQRRDANAKSGRMSTCRFTPDPGAVCRAGVCELGAPAMQVR
jgi:hypothetical protein